MTRLIRSVCFVAMLGAGPALALEPLNTEAHINAQLVAGKVGDTIRKTCPSISARMFVVLEKLNALEDYARAKGYAEADVKVFLKDPAEKARIKRLAQAYLAKAGAVAGDADSYCRVGRDEIAKGTLVGSLLKSWK